MKTDKYITMDTQLKNWKTKTPHDDVLKHLMLKRNKPNSMKESTYELQKLQIQKIHRNFPSLRLYGFHKEAKKYAIEKWNVCSEDYERPIGLPDAYIFDEKGVFIVEIENHSRLTDIRINNYYAWWQQIDFIQYVPLYLMEFNRFGEFQRDVIKESFDERPSTEILKEVCNKLHKEIQ